jgi:hypothetical protein
MNKRIIGIVMAIMAAIGLATIVAVPANAAAGTPGCVTRAEYKQIKTVDQSSPAWHRSKGMTPSQVHTITGAWGNVNYNSDYSDFAHQGREYRMCGVDYYDGSLNLDFFKYKRGWYDHSAGMGIFHAESKDYSLWGGYWR